MVGLENHHRHIHSLQKINQSAVYIFTLQEMVEAAFLAAKQFGNTENPEDDISIRGIEFLG